jgi:hypothetical protein
MNLLGRFNRSCLVSGRAFLNPWLIAQEFSRSFVKAITKVARGILIFAFLSSIFAHAQTMFDSFAWPFDLGASASVLLKGDTQGSMIEPGEPPNPDATGSIWYKWKPSRSGWLYQSPAGPYNFPDLWVYRNGDDSLQGLELVSTNISSAYVFAGTSYYLAAYQHGLPSGHIEMALEVFASPENDAFENAQEVHLTNGVAEVKGWTIGATREPNEPSSITSRPPDRWSGYKPGGVQSVWYKWVPSDSDEVEFNLEFWSAELSVFEDTGGGLPGLRKVAELGDSRRFSAGRFITSL